MLPREDGPSPDVSRVPPPSFIRPSRLEAEPVRHGQVSRHAEQRNRGRQYRSALGIGLCRSRHTPNPNTEVNESYRVPLGFISVATRTSTRSTPRSSGRTGVSVGSAIFAPRKAWPRSPRWWSQQRPARHRSSAMVSWSAPVAPHISPPPIRLSSSWLAPPTTNHGRRLPPAAWMLGVRIRRTAPPSE